MLTVKNFGIQSTHPLQTKVFLEMIILQITIKIKDESAPDKANLAANLLSPYGINIVENSSDIPSVVQ